MQPDAAVCADTMRWSAWMLERWRIAKAMHERRIILPVALSGLSVGLYRAVESRRHELEWRMSLSNNQTMENT